MATIVRWNPFREMAAMQGTLDRLFDESWRSVWPSATFAGNALAFDVHETDNGYTAVVNLPGVNADDINIKFDDGVLTISAEIEQTRTPENGRLLLQERTYGKYERSIRLPQLIDAEHAEAHYENGVLTLNLPKLPEAQPKQIAIKANGGKQLQSQN